jgi:hypothetical protein
VTAQRHPRSRLGLSFSVHVYSTSSALDQLTFKLPTGLSFTAHGTALKQTTVGRVSAEKAIHGSRVTLQLERPESGVAVTIEYRALLESSSLERAIKRLAQTRRHQLVLHGTAVATDEDGVSWTLPVDFRLR